MNTPVEIQLLVQSNLIQKKDISGFKIGFKITNNSAVNINVDITNSELYVNNTKNIAWDLAVQNGTIVNLKVRANRSETVLWPLGNALFDTSGIYEFELRWKSAITKQSVTVIE